MTGYSLDNGREIWSIEIKGTYLRMNEIQQSNDAKKFALAYSDNGEFFIKIFNQLGLILLELNVSEILGIDCGSKPILGIFNPLVTCCFLPHDRLFICVYHRY